MSLSHAMIDMLHLVWKISSLLPLFFSSYICFLRLLRLLHCFTYLFHVISKHTNSIMRSPSNKMIAIFVRRLCLIITNALVWHSITYVSIPRKCGFIESYQSYLRNLKLYELTMNKHRISSWFTWYFITIHHLCDADLSTRVILCM